MEEKLTKVQILDFIEKFKFIHNKVLEYVFTSGNCYYFAVIMKERFKRGEIYYLPIENHFVWKYDGVYYDIQGEYGTCEKAYNWELYKKEDPVHSKKIERDCILFETR